VGPGVIVSEELVGALVGAAVASFVTIGVGAGVAAGAACWEHPATSASARQNPSVMAIARIFFITDGFPGGYLSVLTQIPGQAYTGSSGSRRSEGRVSWLSHHLVGVRGIRKRQKRINGYARFPDAGSIPVGWLRIVRSFMIE
jgi:hypothetical protein